MMNELKSMGTIGTWLDNHTLPEARLVSHPLESISVVKIIIGIVDKGFAMSLVQSFQTAFGVQLNKRLCENGFRAVWEYDKAKMAKSPNDKQARLDFAYAYALLHGSGEARRSDKDTWDRTYPYMQRCSLIALSEKRRRLSARTPDPVTLSPIGDITTIEEESEDQDEGVKITC
ncbi:hypothetical protein DV736_g2756, partial [Chaetothyriales sp. CBS 134916]